MEFWFWFKLICVAFCIGIIGSVISVAVLIVMVMATHKTEPALRAALDWYRGLDRFRKFRKAFAVMVTIGVVYALNELIGYTAEHLHEWVAVMQPWTWYKTLLAMAAPVIVALALYGLYMLLRALYSTGDREMANRYAQYAHYMRMRGSVDADLFTNRKEGSYMTVLPGARDSCLRRGSATTEQPKYKSPKQR